MSEKVETPIKVDPTETGVDYGSSTIPEQPVGTENAGTGFEHVETVIDISPETIRPVASERRFGPKGLISGLIRAVRSRSRNPRSPTLEEMPEQQEQLPMHPFVEFLNQPENKESAVAAFKEAPRFKDQLIETDLRTNEVVAVREVVDQIGGIELAGVQRTTEINALRELDAFFSYAEAELKSYESTRTPAELQKAADRGFTQVLADEVVRFRERATIIGESEIKEATQGFAAMWKARLEENPNANIMIVSPNANVAPKSSEYIGGRILDEFNVLTSQNPKLRNRVTVFENAPTQLNTIGEGTFFIITEDWATSGNTIKNNIAQLRRRLTEAGKGEFAENTEINLVVAREDQCQDGIARDNMHGVKTVAYYHSPAEPNIFGGPMPTGIHSSTDYGWQTRIRNMGETIARRKKLSVELPLLAHVKPPYVD